MAASTNRFTAFDIRLVIALLLAVYGLVLTVLGLVFTTDEELDRSAGLNINLWAGLGMLVGAGLFVLWAALRPLHPDEEQGDEERAG